MLHFLEGPDADVALERDLWGPVNTGCVVRRFCCLLLPGLSQHQLHMTVLAYEERASAGLSFRDLLCQLWSFASLPPLPFFASLQRSPISPLKPFGCALTAGVLETGCAG